MKHNRWWDVAGYGVLAVMGVTILLADSLDTTSRWLVLVALVLCAGALATLGRSTTILARWSLTIALIVGMGAGTYGSHWFAFVQVVAYPVVWAAWSTTRGGVLASAGIAVAAGFGSAMTAGQAEVVQIIVNAGLSFGVSIALGLAFSRQELLDQLKATQARLAAVNQESGAATERERLAREIHDTLAQELTGLVLTAQHARRELLAGRDQVAVAQLDVLEEAARSALAETRALVASGSAVGADDGLATALERLGERVQRDTGITVTVTAAATHELDRDTEVVLLRCAQEALANVRRHSGARSAAVSVTETDTSITLRVTDDGHGFDRLAASASGGVGLSGMRERLALADGTLGIETDDAGTTLTAELPFAASRVVNA